mmetsp:Transcript_35560/g.102239  ORF Transcript_35560/g.102239 Transcript_35560/m.102239 type:complete len:243 (+) Transcript_35560:975-1703(+)
MAVARLGLDLLGGADGELLHDHDRMSRGSGAQQRERLGGREVRAAAQGHGRLGLQRGAGGARPLAHPRGLGLRLLLGLRQRRHDRAPDVRREAAAEHVRALRYPGAVLGLPLHYQALGVCAKVCEWWAHCTCGPRVLVREPRGELLGVEAFGICGRCHLCCVGFGLPRGDREGNHHRHLPGVCRLYHRVCKSRARKVRARVLCNRLGEERYFPPRLLRLKGHDPDGEAERLHVLRVRSSDRG